MTWGPFGIEPIGGPPTIVGNATCGTVPAEETYPRVCALSVDARTSTPIPNRRTTDRSLPPKTPAKIVEWRKQNHGFGELTPHWTRLSATSFAAASICAKIW